MDQIRIRRALLQSLKIAVGSSAAIFFAEQLHLQNAVSAGTIALLTIAATKWETLKLSLLRIVTFFAAVALCWLSLTFFRNDWIAYGVFILILVLTCELLGWKATISVNSVIGVHFLNSLDFSRAFILNELGLVLIGISLAIILNLFHDNKTARQQITDNMRYAEQQMQMLLEELAAYLSNKRIQRNVWDDIESLEQKLHLFIADAYAYQGNTFVSHPGYYIDYFEMRMKQCTILHNLHYEMKKIRAIPSQASVIADYVLYLTEYVTERNTPEEQIQKLDDIFLAMKKEPLPAAREEFESRAILYHILMDLEDFLYIKKRFVQGLNEEQRRRYWENN